MIEIKVPVPSNLNWIEIVEYLDSVCPEEGRRVEANLVRIDDTLNREYETIIANTPQDDF